MSDAVMMFFVGVFVCLLVIVIVYFGKNEFETWIDYRIRHGVENSFDIDILRNDVKRLAEWHDEEDAAICALYERSEEGGDK